MHIPSILASQSAFALLSSIVSAQYSLQDDYNPASFASMFDFFTDADPTSGYVNYVSQSDAEAKGLFSSGNNSVFIGVDATNTAGGRGRDSVRLSSKKTYNHGLIILDLAHMPGGQCGTWPAFWTLGPNWPNSGEIDIIENVNSATTNQLTAHTNAGCSIASTGNFAGTLDTANCDVNAPDQATNAGCSIKTGNTQSYGTGFNTGGGGVYATQWTSQAISIWFFPRSAIPSDITSGSPNPENWGLPVAQFTGGCDIDEHFVNQQIVFDITFCGQWAGQVWSTDATCAPKASTCQDYVQNNPLAFADTYWTINSLKVFQENGQAAPSSSSIPATTTNTAVATTSMIATTLSTATISLTASFTTSAYVAPSTTSIMMTSATSFVTVTSSYVPPSSTQTIYTTPYQQPITSSEPPAAEQTQSWAGWSSEGGQGGWSGGTRWGQGGSGGGWGGRGGPPR
jgi:hypothetical protein